MPKIEAQLTRATKNHSQKRNVAADRSLQNQEDANQSLEPDTHLTQESAIPPSVNSIYQMVTIAALIYGLSTANLLLIYLACIMAIASESPSVLKKLTPLLRVLFTPKGQNK